MFHEYRKRTVVCNVVVIVVARTRWYNEVEPRREPCLNSLKFGFSKEGSNASKEKKKRKKKINKNYSIFVLTQT